MDYPILSDTEAAYLAGIIDGEGSIYVNNLVRGQSMILCVAMTSETTIKYIAYLFNKTYWLRNITTSGKGMYRTQVCGMAAQNIMEQIIPYMITKKPQAEWAMSFPVRSSRGPANYTDDEKVARQVITDMVKRLNSGDLQYVVYP